MPKVKGGEASEGGLVRLRWYVKGGPSLRACGEGGLRDKAEEKVGMLLVREERFVGEGVTVSGDAQVTPSEGETRAKQGEVGGQGPKAPETRYHNKPLYLRDRVVSVIK